MHDGHAVSHALNKALAENSPNVDFTDPGVRETEPTTDTFVGGLGSNFCPERILLVPYGAGSPGMQYDFRLYGWWHLGPSINANAVLWIPLVLAEIRVTLGTKGGLTNRIIRGNEFFASSLVALSPLSLDGELVDGPIAFGKIDLRGCRKFSFDFAQTGVPNPGAFGNVLWAPASTF